MRDVTTTSLIGESMILNLYKENFGFGHLENKSTNFFMPINSFKNQIRFDCLKEILNRILSF